MSAVRKVHNPCPHCGAPAKQRSMRRVTPLFSTLYFQCTDVECSAAWVSNQEISHMISLSAKPNPRVAIPFRPCIRGKSDKQPANDDGAAQAASAH